MNPLTNVKNINKINDIELARGTVDKKSWHDMYRESAWVFIGGLSYGLTEGDILSVFSQYGEIVNINLVRDKKTGKIKGFCFLCYANQKSTVLAVDNFNGIKLCGRTIRVDHVANYKPPKEHEDEDEITKQLKAEGCAPQPIKLENPSNPADDNDRSERKKNKKAKKEKKKHKKNKKKHIENSPKKVKIKKEKHDPGYAKYELPPKVSSHRSNSSSSSCSSDQKSDSDSSPLRRREKEKSTSALKDQKVHNSVCSRRDKVGESSRIIKRKNEDDSSSESEDEYAKRRKFQNSGAASSSRQNYSESTKSAKGRNYSDSSSEENRREKDDSRTRCDPKYSSSTYKQGNSLFQSKGTFRKYHRHDSHDSESDSQSQHGASHNGRNHKSKHYDSYGDKERKHHKRHDQRGEERPRSSESKKHGEVSKSYERESRIDRR